MAEVVEYELREYVEDAPSNIKDTCDFIKKLKEFTSIGLSENCIMSCFDVCKLYPSIPRNEGIEACLEALAVRSDPVIQSTDAVIKLLEAVLDNNSFSLGQDKHYIQTDGVAIGSRLGKNFACCYMRKWDEQLMNYPIRPVFYKRFIDDGFGFWAGSVESLEEFARFANAIHPNIKVELRYSKSKLEFLDTLVILEEGRVYTDLYKKPMDKQLYLRHDSCHPPSTKRGLAYGLGLRIRRICERECDYQRHRGELKMQLRRRGYSSKAVESQLRKVDHQTRDTLLHPRNDKRKDRSKRVPLVLTYSNVLPDVHTIVRKHMGVLHQSERMRQAFDSPPMVAYRRDRNLCDTLVHGKTNKAVNGSKSGCRGECKMCERISDDRVTSTCNMVSFKPAENGHCRIKNVVYLISCSSCLCSVYVGETGREIKERMTEHLRDIRLRKDKPITHHFDGQHTADMARFTILEKLYTASNMERRIREALWIKRLQTARPNGCNVKDTWLPAQLRC